MTELTLEILREELGPLHAETASIKADLVPIKVAVRSLAVVGRAIEALRHETRQLRAAVNDIAALQMTAGEAGALHQDVDHNTTRLDEGRLTMETNTKSTTREAPPRDLIWGLRNIGREINRTEDQLQHLVSSGALAGVVTKVGGLWVASRRKLLQSLNAI